jgi:hypothetical protein
VFFDVYPLNRKGLPLDPDRAKAQGATRGDLRLLTQVANARYTAFVPGSDEHYALPVLMDAELKRIGAEGLLIKGTEVIPRGQSAKSRADYYPQKWLCKAPPDAS